MGSAWHETSAESREVFAQADRVLAGRLGQSLKSLCFDGPIERLNQTDVSQAAIYVTSVACWRGLLARAGHRPLDVPAAAAGLSLGEYSALHIAGAMTFEDGLELVTLRGRAMQDAADALVGSESSGGGRGGMVALIGATDEQAMEVCQQAREQDVLVCANFNAPGQVVLSGHAAACERAAAAAVGMGLRSAMLAVAGAFHSPLMAPAAARLGEALAKTPFSPLRCPVMSNVTAQPHAMADAESIRRLLVEQLTHPVRWSQSCAYLAANAGAFESEAGAGGPAFIELAPGRTLMGLMRRIDKSIKVIPHDTP